MPSYLRDPGTAELGVYLYAPWACSNIVLSGNYIEGAGRALAENDMPSGPTMQGVVVTGNTVAGGQDLFMAMPPEEMESNQWGGALGGSAFQMGDMAIPGWLYFDYDEFLDWAQGKGFGTRSADTPTSLIDMSNFDPQLDAGLSLSQAMALFRTYATGKVDAFAACPAVAQSSTLGGVTTPNINGNLPQAGNDAWSLTAGTTLVVKAAQGVLANDSDPDYELLTAMLVSQPKYGQLTLNSDGSFSYTPNENVSGTDTFTYLASDGHGGTAMATVVLNIQLVPTVNVTDAGGVYNGAPFPATATLTTPGNTQVASLGGVSPTLVYYVGSLTTEQLATATALPDAPSAVGTYTVVASLRDAGYVAAQSAPIIFKITPAVPQVVGVSVSGSAWTSSSLVGGYSIPVGGGAELFPLPAANINQIEVTFNENVIVDQSDLLLTGVNVPSYDVSGGTFSYDPTTFTAIWTLPQPIGPDKLMLTLNADGSDPIRDAAGNRLDGEWTNPTSTTDTGGSTYLSGNGVAGGDFDFRFNVLPGDAAQDGTVDGYALSQILVNYNSSGKTWADGDFNGDGIVDGYDLVVLLVNYNQTLPSGEPAAGSFPADVSFAAATLPTAANSEATVPSQADVIPNVAMADNCMLEEPDVLAAALPTRPATVQSEAPDVFHAWAAAARPDADGPQPTASSIPAAIPAALTAGVGDWSSPPVSAAAEGGLPFVVRPPASATQSLWADGFSTAAGWPTRPLADVAGDTSLWDEAVPAVNLSSSVVPGEKSTGTERTIQDQLRTVFADQARAHDAVLAGEIVAPLPSEASWLSDAAAARSSRHPASDPESLTDAVGNALAAYEYGPYDA